MIYTYIVYHLVSTAGSYVFMGNPSPMNQLPSYLPAMETFDTVAERTLNQHPAASMIMYFDCTRGFSQ